LPRKKYGSPARLVAEKESIAVVEGADCDVGDLQAILS
jgi:hypothetical protein